MLAMGKLGGREMTAGSDLDLIIVYDYEGDGAQSDGAKSLPGQQYYMRFTQRLIAALSADTAEGSLYSVDMRLRPSGNQGPVATKLSSFNRLSGEFGLDLGASGSDPRSGGHGSRPAQAARSSATIREVLSRPRDRAQVAAEVRAMRDKIAEDKGSSEIWDLKHVRGGLIDLEFVAQFLQIVGAAEHPEVLDQNTELALTKLSAAGVLSPGDAEIMVPAARLYHTLTQLIRLCLDKPFVAEDAPRALKDLLARASDMPDFATLEVTLKDTLAAVHEAFDRIVA